MGDAGHRLDAFLRKNRLEAERIDFGSCFEAFLEEMASGLSGKPSTLPMIPTYIEASRDVPRGERVIALDAGGTNLRVAVVHFDEAGAPVIEDLTRHKMPGHDAEIGRDEFFRALADFVIPVAAKADKIGFCFSYPAEMLPAKDGKLIHFTKEIKARGVDGQLIGRGLGEAMAAAGARKPSRIILLNDTVATLLAGRNAIPGRRFDGFMGIVCGTGLNAAYVERNALITKTPGLDGGGAQIINTESGSFGRGVYGDVDDAFNATTATPGKYRHEKTISGAYLAALCLFAAKKAAAEGYLSPAAARELSTAPALSGKELNDFLLYPDGTENPLGAVCSKLPAPDAQDLYRLCDAIVERAAAMVAVTLGAILLKTDRGRDPRYPVCITVDGSTFWQLRDFHCRTEAYMRFSLRGERARAWEITSVEDAPLLGAAIAALTN
jgi:hexokinase